VLITSLVVVLSEIAGLMGLLPTVDLGRMTMPASVFPGAVLLAILGHRAFGRALRREAVDPFWASALAGIAFGAVMLLHAGHLIDAPAMLMAAVGEEVVYRLAVPAVVAAILISWRVPVKPARITGFALAAVWFVLLPGHRMQMHDAAQVLPFIAFAALAAVVAYRSGSILATGAVHTVMNMLTALVLGGEIGRISRSVASACLLMLLVSAYGLVRNRPGVDEEPVGLVIDLREGVEPSVTHVDGTVVPLREPVPADDRADATP
jgi:hypothetical protein